MSIVARQEEAHYLERFLNTKKASFLAVYGRRRVGKTYLIKRFFGKANCFLFSTTGIKKANMKTQLDGFTQRLSEQLFNNAPIQAPKSWLDAFGVLHNAIKEKVKKEKVVIFLDELPWMATKRSNLLNALEYYWNEYWSHEPNLKLIICGSLASWIIKHVIKDTGGFYQRVTHRLKIHPFNLKQTEEFLQSKKIKLNPENISQLYMCVGGIPLYLEQARKGLNADEIVDDTCFNPNGLLVDEINELFQALFENSELYIKISREIAKHPNGLDKATLAKTLKLQQNGLLTNKLKDLEDAGFISAYLPYKRAEKGTYYKITDEYTLFYFRWIEPNLKAIKQQKEASGIWLEHTHQGTYYAWRGYAFEALCQKHLSEIMHALKLKNSSVAYGWRHQADNETGTQIDLLFDRPDDTITICEIKCTDKPFVIDKAYAKNLQNKINIFQKTTQTKKQLFLAFITNKGLKDTLYSEDLVNQVFALKELFS